ncbi:MAG: hypothetical protein JNL32_12755 [Candidatus Kapabacteria bacterium]|nr:hypothetical protein [Candidatus Kapabacteria bacterium]
MNNAEHNEVATVYAVYVMANSIMAVHIAISDDLQRSVEQHKHNADPHSFTTRFGIHNLVYYELYTTQNSARNREVKLKAMAKNELLDLVRKMNPELTCIYERFLAGDTPAVMEKELKGKKNTRRSKKSVTDSSRMVSLRSLRGSDW